MSQICNNSCLKQNSKLKMETLNQDHPYNNNNNNTSAPHIYTNDWVVAAGLLFKVMKGRSGSESRSARDACKHTWTNMLTAGATRKEGLLRAAACDGTRCSESNTAAVVVLNM